jgi:hypothetical protein
VLTLSQMLSKCDAFAGICIIKSNFLLSQNNITGVASTLLHNRILTVIIIIIRLRYKIIPRKF